MAKTPQYTEAILVRFTAGLMGELTNAARSRGVSISEVIRDRCTPAWETPAHQEIDLATVAPEELGLDPYDYSDPLVRKILAA